MEEKFKYTFAREILLANLNVLYVRTLPSKIRQEAIKLSLGQPDRTASRHL